MIWTCTKCGRTFRRANLPHACTSPATARATTILKDRPPALAALYKKLETTVRGFGDVEVVTDNRYALFRTTRIFADLTIMRDALRVVVHLSSAVSLQRGIVLGTRSRSESRSVVQRSRNRAKIRHQPARSIRAETPQWIKVGKHGKRVSHVALVRTAAELRTILPFLREAYDLAVSEERRMR